MANALRKLFQFGKKRPAADAEIPTRPIDKPSDEPPSSPAELLSRLEQPQVEVGYGQSIGLQRDHNEDSLLSIHAVLTNNGDTYPFGLYIVADGMGGHQQGEVASGLAVRVIASDIVRKILLARIGPQALPPDESIQEILEYSLQEAHRTVTQDAPGSGTTLTAILLLDRKLTIAHVGDSRASIIYPDDRIESLTRDHSLVMRMLEMGQLTEEEAAVHPQRNVLYRALGQGESFNPDITTVPLPGRCVLLLCSDGLWGVVSPADIARTVNTTPNLPLACQRLIDAANAAGGPDNITAILVRIPE